MLCDIIVIPHIIWSGMQLVLSAPRIARLSSPASKPIGTTTKMEDIVVNADVQAFPLVST
jgi:hypothetical protein